MLAFSVTPNGRIVGRIPKPARGSHPWVYLVDQTQPAQQMLVQRQEWQQFFGRKVDAHV